MKHYNFGSFATLALLMLASCKKAAGPSIDVRLNGKWAWVSSGFQNVFQVGQSSGVQKTLLFKNDGTVIIMHNDSTGNNGVLQVVAPIVLLPKSISDTATYQVISASAGCVNITSPTLVIKEQYGYQYGISNDTLTITPGACLAPYTTIFAKAD